MKSSDQRVKEGVASRISPHTLERLHSAHTSFDDEAYWQQLYFVWTGHNVKDRWWCGGLLLYGIKQVDRIY